MGSYYRAHRSDLNRSCDIIRLIRMTISQNNPMFDEMFCTRRTSCFANRWLLIHLAYRETFNQVPTLEGEQVEHLEVLAQRKGGTAFYAEMGLSLSRARTPCGGSAACTISPSVSKPRMTCSTHGKGARANELKTRCVDGIARIPHAAHHHRVVRRPA
jgi:hypothetical protein